MYIHHSNNTLYNYKHVHNANNVKKVLIRVGFGLSAICLQAQNSNPTSKLNFVLYYKLNITVLSAFQFRHF
jgi:hypothetical protein